MHRMRVLVVVVCLALLAIACGAEDVDSPDMIAADEVEEVTDTRESDAAESAEGTVVDEDFCAANRNDRACDEFFDSLSDDDYCRILPDDEFCEELAVAGEPEDDQPVEEPTEDSTEEPTEEADEPQLQAVTGPGSIAVAGTNPSATRDDGLCLPQEDAEGDQAGVEFNLAYHVVNGELGAVCFGSPDETVEQAWRVLADLTPPGQLRDLAVFAGFASTEEGAVTLAFVQGLDGDGTDYLMAVNIAETQGDWDEATLTMAHEFTHVFTALPAELDRTIPVEECTTFDNGEGCYSEQSIINQWVELFWQNAPGDPMDEADGEQRCELDSGFFGSYAASTPEEDFAEAFSAYVLRVEPTTDGQGARLDWIDQQVGLQEFKARAVELGYGPLANNFDPCG